MEMSDVQRKNMNIALSFIGLGYKDYIASRVLLNNGLYIQGATLASTAIEKYFKVILSLNGQTVLSHMDKISSFIEKLKTHNYDMTKLIDKVFLDVISSVYKIRYYDNIKEKICIGFFINQFLCELDYIVNLFETQIIGDIYNSKGDKVPTEYLLAFQNKDVNLIENNYLFSGQTKKEQMEKDDLGFEIHIFPLDGGPNELIILEDTSNSYCGQMTKYSSNIIINKAILNP